MSSVPQKLPILHSVYRAVCIYTLLLLVLNLSASTPQGETPGCVCGLWKAL